MLHRKSTDWKQQFSPVLAARQNSMITDTLYPERVDFTQVYHDATQGPHRPVRAIIRSEKEWAALVPGIPRPTINFSEEQLIVVASGLRPSDGFDVIITSVMHFTDRLTSRGPLTLIGYTDVERGGSSDVTCYPIDIVRTRRLDGDSDFTAHVEVGRFSDWKAWTNSKPDARSLHVRGKCLSPSKGFTIALQASAAQGMIAQALVLDFVAQGVYEPGPSSVWNLAYDRELKDGENYEFVVIDPRSLSIRVKIDHS